MTGRLRSSRHRARKGEGALLREEILDVTEDLLYRHGSMDAVSIRAIASRVGVTPPALYLHFEDKDQLFYAVCHRGFDRFAAHLAPVLASSGSAVERIRRLGEEYVRFGLENRQQYPILFGAHKVPIPEEQIADDPGLRILEGLVALVEEAQASGDLRADIAAATVAALLWASVHGLVELLLLTNDNPALIRIPPAEDLTRPLIDTVLAGLAIVPKTVEAL
ncbi:MAG: TetR/AcrR family transcriptional regulator [Acidimicrobiia bacterium]|nr:TetR/AcrR family transcriptional regulator [Acidimicrobiia bacterium]